MICNQGGFEWGWSGEAAARVNSLGRAAPDPTRHLSAVGAPLAGLEERRPVRFPRARIAACAANQPARATPRD
jgi:hypothetical protein